MTHRVTARRVVSWRTWEADVSPLRITRGGVSVALARHPTIEIEMAGWTSEMRSTQRSRRGEDGKDAERAAGLASQKPARVLPPLPAQRLLGRP